MKKTSILIVILAGAFVLLLALPSMLSSTKQKEKITKDIELIEIETAGVSTVILPSKNSDIEAEVEGKGSVKIEKSRSRIKVEYERRWPQFFSFSFFKRSQMTIYLPEKYHRDLAIEVGSGDVHFNGEGKELFFNHLTLEVGSGDIQLDSVTANKAVIDVHSGDIAVKAFAGQLDAEVSSGDLMIEFASLQDSIQADVSSGDLTLKLPGAADFTLNGRISSGEISCDFPLQEKSEAKNELKGIHGSGEHEIKLNVSSGNIEITH